MSPFCLPSEAGKPIRLKETCLTPIGGRESESHQEGALKRERCWSTVGFEGSDKKLTVHGVGEPASAA